MSAIDTTDNAHSHTQSKTKTHTHKYTDRDINKHRNTNTKADTKQNANEYITKAHPGSFKLILTEEVRKLMKQSIFRELLKLLCLKE